MFDNLLENTSQGELLEGAFGVASAEYGISLIKAGGKLAASQYQQAASQYRTVAQFNAGVERINLNRRLDALNKQMNSFIGTQRATEASSGFSFGSKSYLALYSDTLSAFENEILRAKNDSEFKQKTILFEGESAAIAEQNRAAVARYNAKVKAQKTGLGELESIASTALTVASFL